MACPSPGGAMSRLTRFIFRLTDQSDLAFVACVFLILLMGYLLHGCVTTTQLCLDCPYGEVSLNRTMDTSK